MIRSTFLGIVSGLVFLVIVKMLWDADSMKAMSIITGGAGTIFAVFVFAIGEKHLSGNTFSFLFAASMVIVIAAFILCAWFGIRLGQLAGFW